jgi:hypothetical protein
LADLTYLVALWCGGCAGPVEAAIDLAARARVRHSAVVLETSPES